MGEKCIIENKFKFFDWADKIIKDSLDYGKRKRENCGDLYTLMQITSLVYIIEKYKEMLNKEYVEHACFEMDVASALGWNSNGVLFIDQIKDLVKAKKTLTSVVIDLRSEFDDLQKENKEIKDKYEGVKYLVECCKDGTITRIK